jgi:hypothetical protein
MDELKNGLSDARLSCHRFCANFLRLMMHTLALNLLNALRDHKNVPAELRAARPETWRTKIIKIASVVVPTTRRLWIELSVTSPFWSLLSAVSHRTIRARAASPWPHDNPGHADGDKGLLREQHTKHERSPPRRRPTARSQIRHE